MDKPDRNTINNTSLSDSEDSSLFKYINNMSPLKPVKPAYTPLTFNSIGFSSPPYVFTSLEDVGRFFSSDEEALADANNNSTELQDNAHQGVSVDDGTEFSFRQPPQGSDCPPLLAADEPNSLLPLLGETAASHDANVPKGREANSVEGEPKSEGQELNWDSYIDDPTDDVLSFNPDEEIFRPPSMLNQVVDYMSVITQYLLNDESEVDPALPHPDERIAAAADRDHTQDNTSVALVTGNTNQKVDFFQPCGEDLNHRISPNCKRKRANELEPAEVTEGCKRCNCKNSKCLKRYCECFAAGVYCTAPCSCKGCFNLPIHEQIVLQSRNEIMIRNSQAFAPKVISSDSAHETEFDPNKTPTLARHTRGCNCKKSSCNKKYCECFQGGVGCSKICKCDGCKNDYGRRDGSATGLEDTTNPH